jgi:LytS/YehU family sensor histidine kinase
MCLQILVENAIQHNELSAAHPLYVRIESTENTIQISNPIRPRMHTQKGTGTGLQNIQSRYAFFSNEKVLIKNDGQIFMVQLPLLQINQSTTNTHA